MILSSGNAFIAAIGYFTIGFNVIIRRFVVLLNLKFWVYAVLLSLKLNLLNYLFISIIAYNHSYSN